MHSASHKCQSHFGYGHQNLLWCCLYLFIWASDWCLWVVYVVGECVICHTNECKWDVQDLSGLCLLFSYNSIIVPGSYAAQHPNLLHLNLQIEIEVSNDSGYFCLS